MSVLACVGSTNSYFPEGLQSLGLAYDESFSKVVNGKTYYLYRLPEDLSLLQESHDILCAGYFYCISDTLDEAEASKEEYLRFASLRAESARFKSWLSWVSTCCVPIITISAVSALLASPAPSQFFAIVFVIAVVALFISIGGRMIVSHFSAVSEGPGCPLEFMSEYLSIHKLIRIRNVRSYHATLVTSVPYYLSGTSIKGGVSLFVKTLHLPTQRLSVDAFLLSSFLSRAEVLSLPSGTLVSISFVRAPDDGRLEVESLSINGVSLPKKQNEK